MGNVCGIFRATRHACLWFMLLFVLIIRGLLRTWHRFEDCRRGESAGCSACSFWWQIISSHPHGLPSGRVAHWPINIAPFRRRLRIIFLKRRAHLDRLRRGQCLALRAPRRSPASMTVCHQLLANAGNIRPSSGRKHARLLVRCRNSNAASARSSRAAMLMCSRAIWRRVLRPGPGRHLPRPRKVRSDPAASRATTPLARPTKQRFLRQSLLSCTT